MLVHSIVPVLTVGHMFYGVTVVSATQTNYTNQLDWNKYRETRVAARIDFTV